MCTIYQVYHWNWWKTIDDSEDLDLVMWIYNLIEYSSNCSETTGSLWFYSKDDATNFNNKILEYLSNFWRSLEMPLIDCKIGLNPNGENIVLVAAGNDNYEVNSDNIIFIIKDTKLYVPVVSLPAKDNKKLLKLLSKRFERSVHWDKYKTKS